MRVQVKKLSKARKRQLAILGLAVSGLVVVVGSAVYVIESNKSKSQEEQQVRNKQQITATDFTSPQAGVTDNALWMATEGAKNEAMERRIAELEALLAKQSEASTAGDNATEKRALTDWVNRVAVFQV